MPGTRRQLPEAHGPQFPAQRLFADRNAELFEDPPRQIDEPPAHHPVDCRERAGFDDPHQCLPLLVVEYRQVARRLAVHEAGWSLRIEGEHPIPHRLQPDTANLRGIAARPAVIDRRQPQQAPSLSRIVRPLRQRAQLRGVVILPNPNRSGHGKPPIVCHIDSEFYRFGNPPRESRSAGFGINQPKWALRYGFFQLPRVSNGLTVEDRLLKWPYDSSAQDGPFLKAWGMVMEFEQRYSVNNHPGTVRLLAYLNRAHMGSYQEAVDSPTRPADIKATRDYRYKYGFGLNVEQEIAKNIGVFSRLGWSDGQNESWTFADVDYTTTLGISIKGESWHRPNDAFGLAGVLNGISRVRQEFFRAGGTGILAGDGNLSYGWEKIVEAYYNFQIWKTVHASPDYQFVSNPAYNHDRGTVSVFGARLHWEF